MTMQTTKAVHLVFGQSSAGTLKIMLRELGLEHQECVLCFSYLFSVGPIWKLHEKSGWNHRIKWFNSRFFSENSLFGDDQDFLDIKEKIRLLQPDMTIYIWTGESAHEQIGLRYALFLLKKQQSIVVINTTRAYTKQFYQPDSQFYLLHMGEMVPEKLALIYEENKANRFITIQERNRYTQEWERLAESMTHYVFGKMVKYIVSKKIITTRLSSKRRNSCIVTNPSKIS